MEWPCIVDTEYTDIRHNNNNSVLNMNYNNSSYIVSKHISYWCYIPFSVYKFFKENRHQLYKM